MSKSDTSVSEDFDRRLQIYTKRYDDQTNAEFTIHLRENQVEIYFRTPDYAGDIFWNVPWSHSMLERYLNPEVFVTLVQQFSSTEPFYYAYDRRIDVEREQRRWLNERRKKSKCKAE